MATAVLIDDLDTHFEGSVDVSVVQEQRGTDRKATIYTKGMSRRVPFCGDSLTGCLNNHDHS